MSNLFKTWKHKRLQKRQLKEQERQLKEQERQLKENEAKLIEYTKTITESLGPNIVMHEGRLVVLPGHFTDHFKLSYFETASEQVLDLIPKFGKNGSKKTIDCLIDLIDLCRPDILNKSLNALNLMLSRDTLINNLNKALTQLRNEKDYETYPAHNIGRELGIIECLLALKDKNALNNALKNCKKEFIHNYIESKALSLGIKFDDIDMLSNKLNNMDESVRKDAFNKLAEKKQSEPLIKALYNKHVDVRIMSAEKLGELGGNQVVEYLIEILKDRHSKIQYQVAVSLGKLGDKRAVQPLIDALDIYKDRWSGPVIVESLGKIGGMKAVKPLIDVLKDVKPLNDEDDKFLDKFSNKINVPTNPRIKACITVIGEIGDEQAIPVLKNLIKDNRQEIRDAAALSLNNLGVNISNLILNFYALKDIDPIVRAKAAKILGDIGDKRVIEHLKIAFNDKHYVVRKSVTTALKNMNINITKTEFYIKSLKDIQYSIRAKAAIRLAELGDKEAINPLLQAFSLEKERDYKDEKYYKKQWNYLEAFAKLEYDRSPSIILSFVKEIALKGKHNTTSGRQVSTHNIKEHINRLEKIGYTCKRILLKDWDKIRNVVNNHVDHGAEHISPSSDCSYTDFTNHTDTGFGANLPDINNLNPKGDALDF